ncbi:CDGSH iron-sulfur domain-containing protein [Vallicoccus soli]|uniref:CDGSH iron-sulfur domain-containing protein n=1 Tax=Vallicoccus soli TaxID=2339232 RepID=A0A3A3YXT6_9ACTN|nr:CDGSH iron-sulfur domain-containing protein [Vallicoccus soli]
MPDLPRDEVTITPYRDGPLVVRGDFRIVDQDGVELDPGRATVALCRCGRSALKPFCDGSHKAARFRSGESTHRRGA